MSLGAWSQLTRAGTALTLVALLVVGVRSDTEPGRALLVTHLTPTDALATELASGGNGAMTYRDSVPPDRRTAPDRYSIFVCAMRLISLMLM